MILVTKKIAGVLSRFLHPVRSNPAVHLIAAKHVSDTVHVQFSLISTGQT